jgi:hypothetical protein
MRNSKGSRKITVLNCEYCWRATGNDGYIIVSIWPSNDIGSRIIDTVKYDETWIDNGDGSCSSAGDQIVITNRIVRRMIEFAITNHDYDPNVKARELKLNGLVKGISINDAVRASPKPR